MNEILWVIGGIAILAFLLGVGLGLRSGSQPRPVVVYTPPVVEADGGSSFLGALATIALIMIAGFLLYYGG